MTKKKQLGKCGGGKILGVSLNFRTPEEFFAYLDKHCANCEKCRKFEYKRNLLELGQIHPYTKRYICSKCIGN